MRSDQPDDYVDLLYVDADHGLMPSLLNFSILATLLRPKIVLLDLQGQQGMQGVKATRDESTANGYFRLMKFSTFVQLT